MRAIKGSEMKRDAKRVSVRDKQGSPAGARPSSPLVLSAQARSSRPPSRRPLRLPTSFPTNTFLSFTSSASSVPNFTTQTCLHITVAPALFSALASRLKSRSHSPGPDASSSTSAMGQTPSKKNRKGKDKSNGDDNNDATSDTSPTDSSGLSGNSEVDRFLNPQGNVSNVAAPNGNSDHCALSSLGSLMKIGIDTESCR